MRKFVVKVNGVEYKVEVREEGVTPSAVDNIANKAPIAAAPAAATKSSDNKPVAVEKTQQQIVAKPVAIEAAVGETAINAPMPGKIIQVKIKPGDKIEKDQIVVILEAMKMQNEIRSSVSGTVKAVNVSAGQSVKPGEAMIIIG